jgi:hypothetical protein
MDRAHRFPWHIGAWATDAYYADMDGEWPDEEVRETRSDYAWNHNVPGDGKFDVTAFDERRLGGYTPGKYPLAELWFGRVDLSDLPAFDLTEEQLLRRYLDQNHAYRHGVKTYQRRALIDYNLPGGPQGKGNMNNGAWRSFAAMFGRAQVHANPAVDWFRTLGEQDYLWAAGVGFGRFTSISGIGATTDFATRQARVVFTVLYGSYFGDWDNRNNLMRAAIASEDILTCAWLGPQLNANFGLTLQHLALGETVGYAIDVTHHQGRLYHESSMQLKSGMYRNIHISLLGDPTLRLHVVKPPTDLRVTRNPSERTVRLEWKPSPESGRPGFRGYRVYRAATWRGPFMPVTGGSRITANEATVPAGAGPWYMVRALKLEQSPSGTYINASQGTSARVGD